MYQKTIFAVIVALCFLGAQASNAVEEQSVFTQETHGLLVKK